MVITVALGSVVIFLLLFTSLKHKKISIKQFLLIYIACLLSIFGLLLAVTGRLPWLVALAAGFLPLASFLFKHAFRIIRSLYFIKSIKDNLQKNASTTQHRANSIVKDEMNREHALAILGLEASATKEDIIKAHRVLIQKLHPDHGGSQHIAASINDAKAFLLKN